MESVSNRECSADERTGSSTNSGAGKQFNKEKKQVSSTSPFSSELLSQDHFVFMPNATTAATSRIIDLQHLLKVTKHIFSLNCTTHIQWQMGEIEVQLAPTWSLTLLVKLILIQCQIAHPPLHHHKTPSYS